MLVTIYTDGGLSKKTGQAYAYYCKSSVGVIKTATFIGNNFDDIFQVECYAVFKAISVVLKEWPRTNYIVLSCDNMSTVNQLNNKKITTKNKRAKKILQAIRRFKIKIKAKHVKGHQKRSEVKAYLNNWCDKALNEVRKQFNKREPLNK